ncbi:ras-associated and pleckstrin homology domains-containing protein 1-like isoform X4 [Ostrea edulis]|uniref:ras-associated and pleckstrin homology domains-containing protein 1-like isoform X4 n=1 Tax=Ostrea edulis TaxID=37623 RepID=UPI0024AFC063|nr:ras-associated and pleckstrin homology domains-containing protein 1-like isoform X4 [Ostrea edulis]
MLEQDYYYRQEEEGRMESEVEADSDHEDGDHDLAHGHWMGHPDYPSKDSDDTGTVRRKKKTVVTPKMAMESFRSSFLNTDENQDVNLDAILGELCALESQLSCAQSDLHRRSQEHTSGLVKDEHRDSGNDLAQAELDALASEITQSLAFRHSLPSDHNHDFMHGQFLTKHGSCNDIGNDSGETDSAFSENASLPSSESFTSMVTVSSTAEAYNQSDACSMASNASTITPLSVQASEEEHKARLQAEKIRIALEKIKEAKIRKLFVRAFGKDGSSKSILVDEKMSISDVCSVLADKNHTRLNSKLAVIEHMPELLMERILEDHDTLVENMVMWTRDTNNRVLFEEREEKNDLFRHPEKYLLMSSSSEKGASLDPGRRHKLIMEFFGGGGRQVPEVEGVMYLKSEGKKAWKKFFFVLRSSGLYYNPKGKISKASKDLVSMVNFDFVDVYRGLGWKKKYHAPTDYCFALKHPQIQKKTSKYIRYFCTENKNALDQWIMGIRIAKYGHQLLDNYEKLRHEIQMWDYREMRSSVSEVPSETLELNPDVKDSRLSMPDPSSRNSIVYVQNSSFTSSGSVLDHSEDLVGPESRKTTLSSQSSLELPPSGGLQKTHTKRVSFSNTPSVINADSDSEMRVRHRDSITSASTDSSEDSTSSGESRLSSNSSASRGKFRARIPVTTETTRQISEMVQVAMEGSSISSCESDTRTGGHERKPSLTKLSEKEKSRASVQRHERKSSDGSIEREQSTHKNVSPQHTLIHRTAPSPPPLKCPLNYQSIQEDEEVWQRNENFVPTSTYPYHPPHHMAGQMSMPKMPMSPPLPRVYSDPSQERCMSPPPHERFKSPPPPSHGRVMSPPSHHKVISPTSAPIDPWEYRTDLPPPPAAIYSHVEQGGRPQGPLIYQEQKLSKHTVAAPKSVTPKVPQNLSHSPPPPMPPPGPMAKPPSPGTLPFHPPPLTSLSNPMMKQGNGLSEDCESNASSPCPSESSPTTPRGVLAMPPAMPLLQNQYVSLQSGAMGQIKNAPKSGPEVTSGSSKSSVAVAPPTPPAVSMASPPPTSQQKKYPPPLSCGVTRSSASPGILSPVSPMSPPMIHSPQMRNSAHGYEHFDQVRVRPGSQASRVSTGSNTSRTSGGSVQCYPPPPPNPQPMSPGQEDIGKTLPFLDELSKRSSTGSKKVPPQTLPKPSDGGQSSNMQNINGATTTLTNGITPHNHKPEQIRPNSAPVKKGVPPPPPKRSETTRLSSDLAKVKDQDNAVPNVHNSPLYENFQECDGIMDINDLPPPPPELLAGLASDGNVKRSKPPPPPPKRSRETHLTH